MGHELGLKRCKSVLSLSKLNIEKFYISFLVWKDQKD